MESGNKYSAKEGHCSVGIPATVFILCLHLQVIIWLLLEEIFPPVSPCAFCSVSEQERFEPWQRSTRKESARTYTTMKTFILG